MSRETFLRSFLGALGARDIAFNESTESTISGTVVYDPDGPEERQDFRWHMSEDALPRKEVELLVSIIHARGLLDIDKLTVTPETLRIAFCEATGRSIDPREFESILEELMDVTVRMVDDGKETDAYFIHD